MIKLFLQAKHWQLFLLFFAFPLVLHFAFIGNFISTIPFNSDMEPNPDEFVAMFTKLFTWIPIIILPAILGFAGWLWSISVGLHPKLPEGHGLNLTLFKWMLVIPLIIMVYLFYTMSTVFTEIFNTIETQGEIEEMPGWVGQMIMLFPMALISVGCSIYTYYHTAKTIKLVEKGNNQQKPEFIGEFFLIWFYYIGVWILQPKINKMATDDYVRPTHDGLIDSTPTYDN
ncbi:MAG: hypothetical protein ACI9JN_000670 [Bacteroidia bacterium]|jgi:hypothetical protein